MKLEWTTTIAGYDGYNHSGKRSYGSYLIIGTPFRLAWLDWNAQVGIVPYYCSRYSDVRSEGLFNDLGGFVALAAYEDAAGGIFDAHTL